MQVRRTACEARQQKGEIMEPGKHYGHRQRMREKAELTGFQFLPEHEQLEMILYAVIKRGNTNEIAHDLLERFHSIYGVLTADMSELVKIKGVGIGVAEFLHTLLPISGIVERSKAAYESGGEVVFDHIDSTVRFLRSLFTDLISERLYAVYLNKTYRVIKYESLSDGSMDGLHFDIPSAIRSALLNNAYYIVLAHNHPSGNMKPSSADLRATGDFAAAARAVGITLLDHVILSSNSYYSYRERKML